MNEKSDGAAGSSLSGAPPLEGQHQLSFWRVRLERRRSTLLAALGYLAVVAFLFHRLLIGEVLSPAANLWAEVPFRSELNQDLTPYLNGVQGDVWRGFEPWHLYQYRSARENRFPLWNPHVYCGFPFHANAQSAMLSPFQWIYFAVDPKYAVGPMAALRLWIAGFSTFWLGRRLRMAPVGAFVAGAAWMLSAFSVRWLLWNHSAVVAWLPVVLITLDRLVERVTVRSIALAGLVITTFQLSGHPESQFQAGALSGVYVLARVWFQEGSLQSKLGRVLACFAAHVLGLIGASAALLPFFEQLRDSADWHESIHALRWYLPLEELLGIVAPDHFGRPRAGRFYQGPQGSQNYVEGGTYFGLIPLALATVSVITLALRPKRTTAGPGGMVSIIFGIWLLLCVPVVLDAPVVSDLVYRMPLLSKANNLHLLLGVQFAGAMLAGAAWTQMSLTSHRFVVWTLPVVSITIATILGFLLVMPERNGLYSHREGLWKLWADPSVVSPLQHRSLRTAVSFGIALAAVVWTAFCVRFRLRSFDLRLSRFVHGSLVLLVLGDLIWVAFGFNPVVPPRIVFPDPPSGLRQVAKRAKGGRVIASGEILSPNVAMCYGLYDVRGYDFPLDKRWSSLFRRLGCKPGLVILPREQFVPCVRAELQSVCDKSSVRFFYTSSEPKSEPAPENLPVCGTADVAGYLLPPWRLVARGVGAAKDLVYQNPSAYSRAYFAKRVTFAGAETALDAVLNVSHDLREESFVEERLADLNLNDEGPPALATIEFDGAEEVHIRTQSASPGLLVLSDRYDPNWHVCIDGLAALALRTNYLFRGVAVPAGEHLVRWSYRPAAFSFGCAISVVTLMGLFASLLVTKFKTSEAPPSPLGGEGRGERSC